MPVPQPSGRPWAGPAVRAGSAAAALLLALLAASHELRLVARQETAERWLAASGVPVPPELARDPDPASVDLRAARATLGVELNPALRLPADLPADASADAPADAEADRLAEAARLAGGALRERPGDWEAYLVLGLARYMGWSRAHDPRLLSTAPAWERPLRAAVDLAPGRPEPARYLAGAYLEIWSFLSPAARERARRLVAAALADPNSFDSLIAPWLATAASREEVFAAVPPTPEAWKKLQEVYAQQSDWPSYCLARARWDRALLASLAASLAGAERRSAAGDVAEVREVYLTIAAEARPEARYLGLLNRALEGCPPGPIDHRTAERLRRQLAWSLERCRLDRCPLSPRALRRLAGFCRDVDPRDDAMAALATGDLGRAEMLERAEAAPGSEAWAPYRLLKAKSLAERGRGMEAEAALVGIPGAWLARPGYWQVRVATARAAGDLADEAAAGRELARLAAGEWSATAWDFRGGVARLELLAAAAAPGLELTVDVAPLRGAAAEVRLDESILGTFPASAGGTIALPAPISPGLHLLEIESVAGGALLPGTVRLAREPAPVAGIRGEPR